MSGLLQRLARRTLSSGAPAIRPLGRIPYVAPLGLNEDAAPGALAAVPAAGPQQQLPEQGAARPGASVSVGGHTARFAASELKANSGLSVPELAAESPAPGPAAESTPPDRQPVAIASTPDDETAGEIRSRDTSASRPAAVSLRLPAPLVPTLAKSSTQRTSSSAHVEPQPLFRPAPALVAAESEPVTRRALPPPLVQHTAAPAPAPQGSGARASLGVDVSPRGREPEPTEVHVHIGRIEVTAVHEPAPATKRGQKPDRKPMSLDEYLDRRRRRSS